MLSVQAILKDTVSLKSAMILGSESDCKRLVVKYEDILNSLALKRRDYDSFAQGLPEDCLAKLLIPEDVPEKLNAKTSKGDGNCLYNSASLVIYGSDTLAPILRLLVAGELFLNAKYYATHPRFSTLSGKTTFHPGSLFAVSLSCDHHDLRQRENVIRKEAIETCRQGKWAALVQIMALASVLRRPVFSVYPLASKALRPLLHGKIFPRESVQLRYPAPTDRTVYIMFSRDSSLSSIPGVGFNPNHFVPLFPAEDKPRDKQYSFDEKDFPPLTNMCKCKL